MLTEARIKEISKETIIDSIENFAKNSLAKQRKFQILDLIIPDERKIRSIVGGLETSLGSTLWEPLGKSLARENDFNVIKEDLLKPIHMPSVLNNALQTIFDDRKANGVIYDAEKSHESIKEACEGFINNPIKGFTKPKSGRGVDIWLEKNGINYFFDTKTVQPNLTGLTGYLEQVLNWYAYYYSKYPEGNAQGRIVFPYNPTPDISFWDGVIGHGKPLEPTKEAWVQDEFWDFCTDRNGTYKLIEDTFRDIHRSGVLKAAINQIL